MVKKITTNHIINTVLFFYILSIYLFTYREYYYNFSNVIGGALVGLIWTNFLIKKNKFKFNYFLLIYFLFIITCIISIFFAVNPYVSLIQSRTLVLLYILMVSLVNYIDCEAKVVALMKYFTISGFIASVYIFLTCNFSELTRFGAQLGNVNSVGLMIGISMVYGLYFILEEKKYIFLPFVFLSIVIILLTGSRKAFLFTSYSFFIIFISRTKSNLCRNFKILGMGILLILALFYIAMNVPLFYQIIGRRIENLLLFIFKKGTTEVSINERYYMLQAGFAWFKGKPFTGYGLNNFRVLFAEIPMGRFTYAHNNVIELLVGVGLFGTIIYYFTQIIILKNLLKASKNISKTLCYSFIAIISGYLLMSIGMVYYYNKHISIVLAIGSIVYKISESKVGNKQII